MFDLVKEREARAKHLQLISGTNFVTFWLANFLWDYVIFLVCSAAVLIVLLFFNQDGFTSGQQQGRFIIVLLLYGWGMLPLMYLFSFLFTVPSSGFTKMSVFNIFTGNWFAQTPIRI